MSVTVTINAKPHEVADEHLEMSLLRYLREVLGLTGAEVRLRPRPVRKLQRAHRRRMPPVVPF